MSCICGKRACTCGSRGYKTFDNTVPATQVTNIIPIGKGDTGDSAYEVAVNNGFVGTESQWLASLIGPPGADGVDGVDGQNGADGDNGWTPVTALVSRNEDVVEKIIDWVGGEGTKPPVNQYLGETGWVTDINLAKNVRGAQGQSGTGTGDMMSSIYDPNTVQADVYDRAYHTGTQAISTISGLQTQLNGKYNNPTGTTSQYVRGDGTLATFPAIPSGTVTSVGLTAPTGFSVTNSPVTSAGSLVLGFAAGYSLPTNAKQATWDAKEPPIAAGTTAEYWRGDKTWATLNKSSVGLGNVDNTSDLNKPISTATATALNTKQDVLVSGTNIKTINGVSILGSGNIDISGGGSGTTYTAGNGITLTGTEFSVPVAITGTGSYVQTVTQTASGIAVTLGTPPNTTYSTMTAAELSTGTATTGRTISSKVLNDWLNAKNYLTTVAWGDVTGKPTTFTPSAHTHNASDIDAGVLADARIPSLNASKINAGTFGIARIPTGTTSSTVAIGNDSRINNGQTAFEWGNHASAGYAVVGTAGGEVRSNTDLDARYLRPYTVPAILAANKTLSASDKNAYIRVTETVTITMPADLSETDYPIGSTTNVRVSTGATVTFLAGSGVTLDYPDGSGGASVAVVGRKVVSIVRVGTNDYDLIY